MENPALPPEIAERLARPPDQAIARLSHTHEAVMNWLIANPEKSLRECADSFGYSQPWLSRLIHSDLFQQELQAKHREVFLHVAQDIPAKLRGLADLAIEKVSQIVSETESPEVAIDVFDKALHRLGYAPTSARSPGPGPVQQVFVSVSASELAEARSTVIAGAVNASPSPELEVGEAQSLPSPEAQTIPAQGAKTSGCEV